MPTSPRLGSGPGQPHGRRYEFGTIPWVEGLLTALASGKHLTAACKQVGISRISVFRLRQRQKDFRRLYNEAVRIGTELLEQEAERRAYHGVEREVRYKGEVVGHEQEYSDTLLMFLLKGRKPETYRERYDIRSGAPTNLTVNVVAVDGSGSVIQPATVIDTNSPQCAIEVAPEEVNPDKVTTTSTPDSMEVSIATDERQQDPPGIDEAADVLAE